MWRNGMCYFHLNKRRLNCEMAKITNATHLLVWKEPTATIFIPEKHKSKCTCEKVTFWSEEMVVGIIVSILGDLCTILFLGREASCGFLRPFLWWYVRLFPWFFPRDHWLCYKYIQTQWPSYPSCNNHIWWTWHLDKARTNSGIISIW